MGGLRTCLLVVTVKEIWTLMCTSVEVGTTHGSDVVKAGVVQAQWSSYPTQHFSAAISDFYLYVDSSGLQSPDFRPSQILEFQRPDDTSSLVRSWLHMNVSLDYTKSSLTDKLAVYRIQQECSALDGGYTLLLNLTLTSPVCDPIVISWFKTCGYPNQPATDLYIGFERNSQEIVDGGMVTSQFDSDLRNAYTVISERMTMVLRSEPNKEVYLSGIYGDL